MQLARATIGCIDYFMNVSSGRIQQRAREHLTPVVGIGVVDVEVLFCDLVDSNCAPSASHDQAVSVLVRLGGRVQRLCAVDNRTSKRERKI
jgi:hypothetical protein